MKLLSKVLGILLFLMLAAAATAQKNKPWTEWKLKETEKILNDSPWAQTQTITNINEMNYSPANRGGGMGALNQPVNTNFRIRFLSAKPIRQALLRNLVLSRAAEAQVSTAREFVDQTFDDAIVVAVAWDSNDPRYSQLVFTYFSSATTSTLRNETYLEIQGGKRNFLREYQAPTQDGLGGKFIFSRLTENKPFIEFKEGDVRFFAQFPLLSGMQNVQLRNNQHLVLDMRFKIANLIYDSILQY